MRHVGSLVLWPKNQSRTVRTACFMVATLAHKLPPAASGIKRKAVNARHFGRAADNLSRVGPTALFGLVSVSAQWPAWSLWLLVVLLWILVVVVDELVKRAERKRHERHQKYLKVLFATRLGMWSPK